MARVVSRSHPTPPRVLHEELDRLAGDPDPSARAVAAAVVATVLDDLDPGERGWVAALEAMRAAMDRSEEQISIALPSARGDDKAAALGEVCRLRSKKPRWALLLLALTRRLRPDRVLELGTCLGVSSGYLAAGLHLNGHGRLVTLEGAGALADRAARNLAEVGLGNVDVVPGLFRRTLGGVLAGHRPVGLAFIDGHHDEQATLRYFDQIAPALADPAVVVFDDIRWSEGMARAWDAISVDPRVRVVVDVDRVGVCVVAATTGGGPGGARRYRLPTVTVQAAAAQKSRRRRPPDERLAGLLARRPARLHWGCGGDVRPGWVNVDRGPIAGLDVPADLRDGLPLPDDSFDYAASSHALQRIPLPDLVPALAEVRRVLKPGGVLRLCLPDLEKALSAWAGGDEAHFEVSERHARSPSGRFLTHVLWYGEVVSLFTPEWAEELLGRAGFAEVRHCRAGETTAPHAGIVEVDRRPDHSLVVEAVK